MKWERLKHQPGFALPTILIASVIMLIVLVTAVTATESVRTALDRQYYNQLAREAAESGLARAQSCLVASGYSPEWNDSYPLRPDRDCTGVNSSGANRYLINQDNVRTTFDVYEPDNQEVSQLVESTGTVELIRPSTGQPWKTYTYSASARIGVSLSLSTVVFGYAGGYGAYYGTITSDGSLRMAGFNSWGILGNGTNTNTLVPKKYILNGNDKPIAVFTNFVSNGFNTFVLTQNNEVYGSGYNGTGQLGDGSFTSRYQAVKYGLPAGKLGKSVTVGGYQTYVLTTDGKVYSSGSCSNGKLGYGYTISGCTDQSTPKLVILPANATTNIVTDYESAFVRLTDGRVYGWGGNTNSMFGNGNSTAVSTPVQIGSFGNAGQPKAKDVQTDGVATWVLDDSGDVSGAGYNYFGQMGGAGPLGLDSLTNKCLDNKSQNGVDVQFYNCNNSPAQDWTWGVDGSLYVTVSSGQRCLNAPSGQTVNLAVCDGTTKQKWTFNDDRTIRNVATGKCLNNAGNDGVSVIVYTCSSSYTNELFTMRDLNRFVKMNLPPIAGTPIKIATDQWFVSVLTSNGQVWSAGLNNVGQLGNGKVSTYQPYPVQFKLPAGVTAVDVFSSAYAANSDLRFNNVFVIGSDGRVYGAGSNAFGQLGDGTTTNRSTPVPMLTIDGQDVKALQVESGYGTTVVVADNNKVYTVGNNENGQLGDGTTNNSSVPKANQYTNVLPVTMF